MKRMMMVLATTTFVIILLGSLTPAVCGDFDLSTLTWSTSGLNLFGGAEQNGGVLRLTSATLNQAGAAWYTTSQYVQYSFETTFQFQISQTGV